MGVNVLYGGQKEWYYGGTFDGMLKTPSGITDFKYGQNNDFLYPNDKQVASRLNAGAHPAATVSLKFTPKVIAIGHATATDIRKIGGVSPIYDGSRYWSFGLPTPTLVKKDFGQTFWFFGGASGDIFASTQGAIAIAHASANATVGLKFTPKTIAIGHATATDIRRIGGAIDTQGGQKYWATGQAMGLAFFALGNSVHVTNKAFFADQRLWYFGLATPDLVGTPPVAASTSLAKLISARMLTKRQVFGWPPATKIVDPGIPSKKSNAT